MKNINKIILILVCALLSLGLFFACEEERAGVLLKFDSNGGTPVDSVLVPLGSIPVMPDEPTKEGYKFSGWYIDNNTFLEKFEPEKFPTMMVFSNILYAKWVDAEAGDNAFTVSFNSRGGTPVSNIYRKEGAEIVEEPKTIRDGYFFEGWSASEHEVASVTFPFTVSSNIMLYARWSRACTVQFNSNSGSPIDPVRVRINSKLSEPEPPMRTGFVFWAWYTESSFINQWSFETQNVSSDMVLYARWENMSSNTAQIKTIRGAIIAGSTITMFVDNDVQTVTLSDRVTVTNNCTWKLSRDTAGMDVLTGNIVTGLTEGSNRFYITVVNQVNSALTVQELTIYRNKRIQVDFYRNYDYDDNELHASSGLYEENKPVPVPQKLQRAGFTFGGWFYERVCINEYNFNSALRASDSLKLYARWISEKINIKFNYGYSPVSGNQLVDSTVDFGTAYLWHVPIRKGYKFEGWWSASSGTGTQYTDELGRSLASWSLKNDADPSAVYNVYAKWVPEIYKITYNNVSLEDDFLEGTVIITEFSINVSVVLPIPVREGASFEGWYKSDKMLSVDKLTSIPQGTAQNIDLFAKWSAQKYKINYVLNSSDSFLTPVQYSSEGVNHADNPAEITYGSGNIILKAPTRAGFVFDGWYIKEGEDYVLEDTIPEKSTTGYTFYAKWELANYNINYHLGENAQNNPSNGSTYNITMPSSIILAQPTRLGYTFAGWFKTNAYLNPQVVSIETALCADIDLYAKWTPREITVVYGDVLSQLPTKKVSFGSDFSLAVASKSDSDFQGWYTQSSGGGEQVSNEKGEAIGVWRWADASVSVNTFTVYAYWTPKKYTITLNHNNDSVSPTKTTTTILHNASDFILEVPVRIGYKFEGWWDGTGALMENESRRMTDKDGNSINAFTKNQSCELFAKWTAEKYQVVLNATGGKIDGQNSKTIEVTFGQSTNLGVPVREGYLGAFYRWMDIDENMFTGGDGICIWLYPANITLYADWYISSQRPIATMEQLKAIGTDDKTLRESYFLVQDIILTGTWTPLGSFSGMLNGNGYSIKNLQITSNINGNTGLFSENRGTIMNLGLETASIEVTILSGRINAGLFAGANYGLIQDCFVSGSIKLIARGLTASAGSAVGLNAGDINSLWANVNIDVDTLSGTNGIGYAGGIVGENAENGRISGVLYAPGKVTALTGGNNIIEPTDTGYIQNKSYVESFKSSSGGVAGRNSGQITNAFAFNGIHYKFLGDNKLQTNISAVDMRKHNFFRDRLGLNPEFWNINDSNTNPDLSVSALPVFKQITESSVYYAPTVAPEGTVGNPFVISTADALNGLRNNLHFSAIITATINLESPLSYEPIGNAEAPYSGTLTCSGSQIYIGNLSLTNPTGAYSYIGLFGVLTGTVRGIIIRDLSLDVAASTKYAGAVAGINAGFIENTTLDGVCNMRLLGTAEGALGGLTGLNLGTIYRVKVDSATGSVSGYAASVSARRYLGGIAGDNQGIINNAYSITTINGGHSSSPSSIAFVYAGGIAGRNKGLIKNIYFGGQVNASISASAQGAIASAGGLAGINEGVLSNGYTFGIGMISASAPAGENISAVGGAVGQNTSTGTVSRILVLMYNYSLTDGGHKYLNTIAGKNDAGASALSNCYYNRNIVMSALEKGISTNKNGSEINPASLNPAFFENMIETSEINEWAISFISHEDLIYPKLRFELI